MTLWQALLKCRKRLLRPGGLFRLVFPAHSPFCMNLSETQRRRQTQRKSAKIS